MNKRNKKKKEKKLALHKEVRKLNREEQLKSGAKLITKVIPDKTKYTRKKKSENLEEDI